MMTPFLFSTNIATLPARWRGNAFSAAHWIGCYAARGVAPGPELKAGLARMRFALPQSMPSLYRLSNQPTMKNDGGFNGLVVHPHCRRVRGGVAFRLEMVSEVPPDGRR
jgi:hypothetical protein